MRSRHIESILKIRTSIIFCLSVFERKDAMSQCRKVFILGIFPTWQLKHSLYF